ncbi:hypothetical protein M422DRAFT_151860 [Sphaerobolus stellatus SS14]|nr:hypothetical protein M422DRAFT_151860 [Sphaerobolus stellatus SS14]
MHCLRRSFFFSLVLVVASPVTSACASLVKPFRVDLTSGIPRMKQLIRRTHIPQSLPPIAHVTPSPPFSNPGMDAEWLNELRKTWLETFDWKAEQDYINSFNHFQTRIESLDIHFVYARSKVANSSDVIPLLLTHGWPGSFLEYLPVVESLTSATTVNGRTVSFDVIIPSIPGFAFSSPPPAVWTVNDTARIWNSLMIDILGYETGYSVSGSDWGALINWCLLNEYPEVKAAHFNFLAIVPPSKEYYGIQQLNKFELSGLELGSLFFQRGTAYFNMHQTKPWTLGLALADSPMGQLTWIAEKYRDWSDPSFVNVTYILSTASLYFLTGSFPTTLYVYAQNFPGFAPSDVKAVTSKPFGYATYQWEGVRHPKVFLEGLGNLTYYKEHIEGGHFPFVELPEVYAQDIIEMMANWYPNLTAAGHGSSVLMNDVQRPLILL